MEPLTLHFSNLSLNKTLRIILHTQLAAKVGIFKETEITPDLTRFLELKTEKFCLIILNIFKNY